ncbi:MAG TPA: UvrD-helicase domain-containing protein, partial [Gallionellaceae bacterium]|nr:UvrD-helicase domain-containing protein [Gallionellaceae bacterium]
FLHERAIDEVDGATLARARSLYRDFLLSSSSITISTFHGWFMQIIQRAPLNADVPVGLQLLERTGSLREEAWDELAEELRNAPDSELAQEMQWLFEHVGLASTRTLLENFLAKRAEWWAYTLGQRDPVGWALGELRDALQVDEDADPLEFLLDQDFDLTVQAFASLLQSGTEAQQKLAATLDEARTRADLRARFDGLFASLHTAKGEPNKKIKPNKGQNEEQFSNLLQSILLVLHEVQDALAERDALRLNQAGLHCGVALLAHYQQLKLRQQGMDFTDVEWQVARLLRQSDSAEYMQYKLDSRYKHVLLDEFQDTNPLQWQILQAWFAASAAADQRPRIFVVGDPKQSIYRFRRADSRLFGEVSQFLQAEFDAHFLNQNETRRNAPAVLAAVNGVFESKPDGFVDFETHTAHLKNLPGSITIMPLQFPLPGGERDKGEGAEEDSMELILRNPLLQARDEADSGARELEAEQFAEQIANIVATWNVQDANGKQHRATWGDIMVLVRKRTHLRVYEAALRHRNIPFLTSRRGGLLDTLEAEDIQALLTFLITPFADLALAQTLRSPMFSCSDQDLMQLAQDAEQGSWWARLQRCATTASPALQRAHALLQDWLQRADKLPVHDLLDHIYFSADVPQRYAAAVPEAMRATVHANLQAFMEIALDVDGGRYPSLPRFLAELGELREADNEAPDEGKVGEVGNALRIYTVHEAKGLEAPIVWLLDANDTRSPADSYGVLLDWPTSAPRPSHFSLYATRDSRGKQRLPLFEAEEHYARREGMNLLYVALTRARQALIVSGNGKSEEAEQKKTSLSWYDRLAQLQLPPDNPLQQAAGEQQAATVAATTSIDPALQRALPTGQRAASNTIEQRRGTWLHALLQHLTTTGTMADQPA